MTNPEQFFICSGRSVLDIFSDGLVGDICYGHRPPRLRTQTARLRTQTGPTWADPPQGEATPEIGPVGREEILF